MISYPDALSWLFSQTRAGQPRSLERMQGLWRALGLASPKNCIYVVGTNGKGSVSTMLAAALSHAGFKTGLFISPHVTDFRERISVDNVQVSELAVRAFVERVKDSKLELNPAFFEWSFALALEHFASQGVDWAVIEAGIGAKLDATNTLAKLRAVVITNVALDHQNALGSSLAEIAVDKAAAIRKDVPTFTSARGEALTVIEAQARQKESPLAIIPTEEVAKSASYLSHIQTNKDLVQSVLRHFKLAQESITAGLASPSLPARLESFKIQDRTVILDGAHNSHAIQALIIHVNAPFTLIFGAHKRKSAQSLLNLLEPSASQIILTRVSGEVSALESDYHCIPNPLDALSFALEHSANSTIVITGSFYLAGDLRPELMHLSQIA